MLEDNKNCVAVLAAIPAIIKFFIIGLFNLKNVKKRRRSSVVVKFRNVSNTVWVCFEAVIIENTLKEN